VSNVFDVNPLQSAFVMGLEDDWQQCKQDPEQDDLQWGDQLGRQFHINEAAAPDNTKQPKHGER